MNESEALLTDVSMGERRTRLRHRFAALCAAGIAIVYTDRGNMALSIIPMSEEFGWSSSQKGTALSAFFYGYVVTQIFSGWAADVFGGVKIVFYGMLLVCISMLLVPFCAERGIPLFICCRVLLGLFEGFILPVFHSMVGRWIPPVERPLAIGLFSSAVQFGVIAANIISPPIISSVLGWRYVFYFFGILGLFWAGLWLLSMANTPREHRNISEKEILYIEQEIRKQEPDDSEIEIEDCTHSCTFLDLLGGDRQARVDVPWRQFFSSRIFWAVLVTQFSNSWCFFVFQQWLPTYYREAFLKTPTEMGLSVVVPYIAQCFCGLAVCYFCGRLLQRENKTLLRKTVQFVAMIVPALCLGLVCMFPSSYLGVLACFTIGIMTNSLSIAGLQASHMDIGPRYAGVLYGLINTVSIFAGLLGIKFSGWLLEAPGNWTPVWGVCSLHYVLGGVVWILFYSSEVLFV